MKYKKQILLFLICFCTLFFVNSINSEAASIKISSTSALIGVGNTKTLTATVTGASKTVKWSSSDKTIATVTSKGVVKGIKAGKCTIKATANGKTATCTVKVSKLPSKALLQAYAKKLKQYDSDYKFGLVYVNYDLIPELVVVYYMEQHVQMGEVFTYTGGKVKQIKNAGSQFASFSFVPKKSVIVNISWANGYGGFTCYRKLNSDFTTSVLIKFSDGWDRNTGKEIYTVNDKKVSKSTFTSKTKAYQKKYPYKTVTPYNTYPITQANINKLLDNYKSMNVKF